MKVSVILPAYNEAGNIIELIDQIITCIPSKFEYEIILVDDNSPDQTYKLVKEHFKNNRSVFPIVRKSNRGLAKSILEGINSSVGEIILVMDCDFTHDPLEIPKLIHVGEIYDIVSGSRFCAGGNMQDPQHYYASMVYNWFMRIILRTQVQDNLGGYFTIRRNKLSQLPLEEIFFGYGDYYFRLLHFAQKHGLNIVEIPAKYQARRKGESKSNFIRMLFAYTYAMFLFKMDIIQHK